MKGLFKGIRHFTQIFVHKEHEMVIGPPTEVRHVGHISGDGFSNMDWVNDLKLSSEISSGCSSSCGQSRAPSWASQDFEQEREIQATPAIEIPEIPKAPKKGKRKKTKSSPPSSSGSSSTRSSRPPKLAASCATSTEGVERRQENVYVNVEVA